jgi:hypothetical protein
MAISLSNAISGKREPKRGNRWILKFETVPMLSESSDIEKFSNGAAGAAESLAIDLHSASRPNLSVNASEDVSRLNEKWKFAHNPTWENITVEWYDFDSGKSSATQIMWRWMQTIYDVLNGTMGYAASYKTDASLILLGPGQSAGSNLTTDIQIIEAWDLFGCFPNNISTNELSYESVDPLMVSAEFYFDYANLHTDDDYGTDGGKWSTD